MRSENTFTHTAETVKGSIKQALGRLTGRRYQPAESRGDRFKGNLKQAAAKVKDAARR
jgi:uncharacterized protein YjbJ (UPF0337 family)